MKRKERNEQIKQRPKEIKFDEPRQMELRFGRFNDEISTDE